MKKIVVLSLVATFLLTACNKDKPEIKVSLKHKWTVDNYTGKEYSGGTLVSTTTIPGDGTTFDFQDNGNVIITSPGLPPESYPYTIKPDSKVEFDGETFQIIDLTASTVSLFIREDLMPGDFVEIFINMRK